MIQENIIKTAKILYDCRINLKRIDNLPSNLIPQSKDEAYKIQDELAKLYIKGNSNTKLIGMKIGCTNKAAQDQINVKEPFYGNLFSNYSSSSNCSLSSKSFFKPFVEPEFSFKIGKELDLTNAPYSSDIIYNHIESVLPSIELVDSRFNDWKIVGINNLIADNAVNAFWVYGNEYKNIDQLNFLNHSLLLKINNKTIDEGNSKNVLGNPINSLTWLINTLAKCKKVLPKNSYISTGTCTPAIPINKNDEIKADFGELGLVQFNYT